MKQSLITARRRLQRIFTPELKILERRFWELERRFLGLERRFCELEQRLSEAEDYRQRLEDLLGTQERKIGVLQKSNNQVQRDHQKTTARLTAIIDLLGNLYMERQKAETNAMTPQERAWFGKHGFRYIVHHAGEDWEETRVPFWKVVLDLIPDVTSICEFGANIGANLKAIRSLRPQIELHGIEVNPIACDILEQDGFSATQNTIAEVDLHRKFDLVFTRGVLIHIKPAELEMVLRRMAYHSSRYVMIFEHFSEQMHSLESYGKAVAKTTGENSEGYQFWGDFSGEFAKLYPDWIAVQSGVQATVDRNPKEGDLHWTIFKRPKKMEDIDVSASR